MNSLYGNGGIGGYGGGYSLLDYDPTAPMDAFGPPTDLITNWNQSGLSPIGEPNKGFLENELFQKGNFFGHEGGFGSLAGFGKDLFSIYGGLQELNMARDMFDTQKKYAEANLWNKSTLMDERRDKQRQTLRSNWAPGQAPNRSYLDNPEQIRRTV